MTVRVFAPAKINLTLHVTGQRDDGYHLLDSLVVFADVGDEVSAIKGEGLTLVVSGSEGEAVPVSNNNSILQAARFMGASGISFSLIKNLPTAAGIGGGTADAAAALRAISKLQNIRIPANVLPLGADVPVCLQGGATRMSGVGELLKPLAALPRIYAVLVNPRVEVSTAEIFASMADKDNAPMPSAIPEFNAAQEFGAWLSDQRNDLQETAIRVQPKIATVLSVLESTSGLLTRMSGSGATCFALFDSADVASTTAKMIQHDYPDWWVRDTRLN